ncbi:hypothetical protein [Flammeovirga sp. SJP92]|uniref:hypothetical protein n=1 Tax=Flammeovirga sp. SJP92 TaxID=1775430 RepID=UPI0012FB2569|nr:hypothetical protein [Flammeovirga sp. SJP92]
MVLAISNPTLNFSSEIGYLKGMRYEDLYGKKTSEISGNYNTYQPNISFMINPMSTDDALDYEVLAAKEMGIDGFKFQIPVCANSYYVDRYISNIIRYIKAAENRKLDFTYTVELLMDRDIDLVSETQLYDILSYRLSQLFKNTKYSDKWLRSTKGEIVIFTSSTLDVLDKTMNTTASELAENPKMLSEINTVFGKLVADFNAKFAFVFETKYPSHLAFNNEVLKIFPAITQAKNAVLTKENIKVLKKACDQNSKPFIQNVFPDYLNSQLILKASEKVATSKKLSLEEVFVKGQYLNLTATYRELLNEAVVNDAAMINLYSWNSFEKGTHIAPEAHHGFGYGLLLRHYKRIWLDDEDQSVYREFAMTSYKAYSSKLASSTNPEVRYEKNVTEAEDQIEVVTLLNEPADVYCNGTLLGNAPAGIHVFYAPYAVGKVAVEVKRKSKEIISYTTPKAIQSQPSKMDWMTYSYTNLDKKMGLYFQKYALDFVMRQMYRRFLLSTASEKIWRDALQKRYLDRLEAFYQLTPQKFMSNNKKIEKKYRDEVKKVLDEFQYKVWLEMEENDLENQGVTSLYEPTDNGISNRSNLLESDDSK